MHLWDILLKYEYFPDPAYAPKLAIKVPNGTPLPTAQWERAETAVSDDEAQHLLSTKYSTITQAKC